MLDVALHAPLSRTSLAWWRRGAGRDTELLALAREVESEQPALADDLRGIAMHEECAIPATRSVATVESGWRRVARGVWEGLQAVGRARAHRELAALADRCHASQPQLAKELREACSRL